MWKWSGVEKIMVHPDSKWLTPGWENKQLIQSGVSELAWCKQLVLIDQNHKLHCFHEKNHQCSDLTCYEAKQIFSGTSVLFTDFRKTLWCGGRYNFDLIANDVMDAWEVDGNFVYVKKLGSNT